jgi:beta-N-acetylhexosaminidase
MSPRRLAAAFSLVLVSLGVSADPHPGRPGGPRFADPMPPGQLADRLLAAMSPEEKLGQVFFVGYQGTAPSESVRRWIVERGVGGVKIFTRNITTLDALGRDVAAMQKQAVSRRLGIPILVATDQEGGWVQHIRAGASDSPGNMALAASGNPGDAYLTGFYVGRELRALGINMNFAPDVDVYSNPSDTVIGPRAFSSDPVETALFSVAYFRGMEAAGVIATAKHFPGHGGADRDSHGYLPIVHVPWDTLWERDLVPYRLLIREGVPAVMSGHLAFPEIQGEVVPTTLSSFFLNDVLRHRLGFDGVIVTDDLEMHGVHQGRYDAAEVTRLALEAGNDMVLLSHTPALQDEAWEAFRRLVYRDDAFRRRVHEAARRVLMLKLTRLKDRAPAPETPPATAVAAASTSAPDADPPAPETAARFFLSSSVRAVTAVAGRDLPYAPRKGERVLLMGQLGAFFDEGHRRFAQAREKRFSYVPWEWALAEDLRTAPLEAQGYDTVVFCLANLNSLEVLERLRDYRGRLIVISALSPIYLDRVPWVRTAIAVYGMGTDSFRAGFAALAGDFVPQGALPVELPALAGE